VGDRTARGVISEQFRLLVPHGKLAEAIASLEGALRSLKKTPYHAVLGTDFRHHTASASEYLATFFEEASRTIKVKALYFEMNGFETNPDRWFFDGFAYKRAGDIWGLDWLSAWDAEPGEEFVLTGMASVQQAFAKLYLDKRQPLVVQLAGELAEHLVTARFMELVAAAHKSAKGRSKALRGLPVLSTAHEWDVVHRTT